VDNGSSDDSVPRFREQAAEDLILIENQENLGFAGGNNVGLGFALEKLEPDYLLLLNNDTVVDPHFLEVLVDYAQQDESIGVVGPTVYYYHDPHKIAFLGGYINPCNGKILHYHLNEEDEGQDDPRELDFVSGCSLLIKRETVNRVGLLDPQYFLYNEDVDWCLRAKKAGYQVCLVPSGKIWHKVSASAGKNSPTSLYYWGRNQFLLVKNHCPHPQRYLFYLTFITDRIILSLAFRWRGQKKEARAVLKSIKDGVKNNFGFRPL
jgi:GT2 family glycosyltransferase